MSLVLLDLFCKAGGAGMGYHRAGFEVVGVDIEPQKNYPFKFVQADALEVVEDDWFVGAFDAIHASPPCQFATSGAGRWGTQDQHVNLIPAVRELLIASGKPYII